MRVLHVIPSVGPLRGGPSVAMGLMARALRDAGVQVEVATTNDNDRELLRVPIGEPVDEAGVRYRYFPRSMHPYTTSAGLARWLRRHTHEYDVVHTHALFSFATTAAASAARRQAVPYIVRPLGTLAPYGMQQHAWIKTISWLLLERRILTHAAAIHFTSEAERVEAERLGRWRSAVVPLGIEPVDVQGGTRATGDLTLLFLSRIDRKKRIPLLLDAFAKLAQHVSQARLLIAGSGEERYVDELKQRASELRLGAAVEWLGQVSGADKRAAFERAHAFVLPSINENFGIAAVEALSAGLPVVLTRGVAIHREVTEHDAGVVSADDAESLAAAMLMLNDPETRRRMSGNARILAQETFSVRAMQQGLLQLYQRVLAG